MRKRSLRYARFLAKKAVAEPLKLKKRRRNLLARLAETGSMRSAPSIHSDAITINAPEELSFSQNFSEVTRFLEILRAESSANSRKKLHIELKNVKFLAPAAALALVAELDRWQRLKRIVLRPTSVGQWNPVVRSHLASMGFFNLLGTPGFRKKNTEFSNKMEYWFPFLSSFIIDGAMAKRFRGKLEKKIGVFDEKIRAALYRPIIEAMKNAIEHAYPTEFDDENMVSRIGRRWWLFGTTDKDNELIKIIFLDQGITIPRSLPNSWMWTNIFQSLKTTDDSERIVAAAEYGKSRHAGQSHRGKGLHNIVELASANTGSSLRIISRHGYCSIRAGENFQSKNYAEKLNGTLIEWKLNLRSLLQR